MSIRNRALASLLILALGSAALADGVINGGGAGGGVASTPITNSLGADVAMNNAANYFDGPTVAQGSTGTWFACGTLTMLDTAGAGTFLVKLWDGTTVISSSEVTSVGASNPMAVSLCGYLATPAGNIRLSGKSLATTGVIKFNVSSNSKDSTISAYRIQ